MDIEKLRKFCLGLPGATEDVKWGNDLCFCVCEKIFCATGLEDAEFAVTLKVGAEEFHEMCSRPGIAPARYVGRYNHVTITGADTLSAAEWKHYIRQSYDLTSAKLSKKIRLTYGLE